MMLKCSPPAPWGRAERTAPLRVAARRVYCGAGAGPSPAGTGTPSQEVIPMLRLTGSMLVLLLAVAHPLAAQDDRWQVTLDGDRYVWDIQLVRLDGDSLVVRQSDSLVRVPVAHINEIRLIHKSEVQITGGGGAGAGAMNALVGGDDEVYDLTPLEFSDRLRSIQKILLLHPSQP